MEYEVAITFIVLDRKNLNRSRKLRGQNEDSGQLLEVQGIPKERVEATVERHFITEACTITDTHARISSSRLSWTPNLAR